MGPGAGAGGMYGASGLPGGGFGGGMGSDGLGGFGGLGPGFMPINGGVGGAGGAPGGGGGGGGLGGETTSQPGEYVCLICGRSFEQFHKLNHHKRYHERPHACPYDGCDKSFGTKTHLQRHINDKHVTKWSYYCTEPTCQYSRRGGGRSFPRKDNWRRHMIKKHSITPPPGEPGPDVVDMEDVPPPPPGPGVAGAGGGDPGPKVPPGAVVLGVAMPGQRVNAWGLDVDGDFDMEDDDDGNGVLAGV